MLHKTPPRSPQSARWRRWRRSRLGLRPVPHRDVAVRVGAGPKERRRGPGGRIGPHSARPPREERGPTATRRGAWPVGRRRGGMEPREVRAFHFRLPSFCVPPMTRRARRASSATLNPPRARSITETRRPGRGPHPSERRALKPKLVPRLHDPGTRVGVVRWGRAACSARPDLSQASRRPGNMVLGAEARRMVLHEEPGGGDLG